VELETLPPGKLVEELLKLLPPMKSPPPFTRAERARCAEQLKVTHRADIYRVMYENAADPADRERVIDAYTVSQKKWQRLLACDSEKELHALTTDAATDIAEVTDMVARYLDNGNLQYLGTEKDEGSGWVYHCVRVNGEERRYID